MYMQEKDKMKQRLMVVTIKNKILFNKNIIMEIKTTAHFIDIEEKKIL